MRLPNPIHRSNDHEYREKVKILRHVAKGFDTHSGYDLRKTSQWTNARKSTVTKYWKKYQALTSRPYHVYRPRKKKNLAIALNSTGAGKYKKFKAAIIQVPTELLESTGELVPVKPVIKIKKGQLSVNVERTNRTIILFDDYGYTPEDIANDPQKILNTIINDSDCQRYSIIAGEFEIGKEAPRFYQPEDLAEEFEKITNRYVDEGHHYKDWMMGVVGYNFKSHKTEAGYFLGIKQAKAKRETINKQIRILRISLDKMKKTKTKIKRKRYKTDIDKPAKLHAQEMKITQKQDQITDLIIARSQLR